MRSVRVLGPLLVPLVAWGAIATAEEDGWKRVLKKKGVTVWEKGADERPLPLLRAETRIDATPIEIAAVIRDVSGHTEWVHNCKEARVLRETDVEQVVYNVTQAPWPVKDRWVVMRGQMEPTPAGGIRITFGATDEMTVEPGEGAVQMAHLVGSWELEPDDKGRTEVLYTLDADPGGSIPKAIIRQTADELPLNTLVNLKKRVKKTRGNYEAWINGPGAVYASAPGS